VEAEQEPEPPSHEGPMAQAKHGFGRKPFTDLSPKIGDNFVRDDVCSAEAGAG
jgi:hypothetical protein